MVIKCTAVCLVALAVLGSLCDAQGKWQQPNNPRDQQQSKQTFGPELKWTYPEDPKENPTPAINFVLRYPVPATTVAVQCRERDAHVEVKKDMFGTGQFINPADLTLGTCGAVGEDTAAQVLIFEAELHECGSTSMVSTIRQVGSKY